MSPWRENFLNFCRNILHFALWFCAVVNGLMLGVFSIAFTYEVLVHTWRWCQRVMFDADW
jgi:hypothetical protein